MYSYEINVGYSVTDEERTMTVPAILDCFQDAAIFEAENGKITMDYLYDRHMAWLLSSWQIVFGRRPKLNERIKITTFPYDFKGFLGYRNFTLTDVNGEILVKAASIWSLVNTQKLCPTKLEQELIDGYEMCEKLQMDYAPRKIALIGSGEQKDILCVRRCQIDSNKHMNNAEYVRLAMEYLPEHATVQELRVEYKKAAYLGDKLSAVVYMSENKCQVRLNDVDGNAYAITEFII